MAVGMRPETKERPGLTDAMGSAEDASREGSAALRRVDGGRRGRALD